MNILKTNIDGLMVLEPIVYGDDRGFFLESWNNKIFNELIGFDVNFVQDNHSLSQKNTLRGLHYQSDNPQGKLVRVLSGAVLDVVVDLRPQSDTFGQHFSIILNSINKKQLWVPKGFAHGFLALEDNTQFLYKCDDYYHPSSEISLSWCDEHLSIDWGVNKEDLIMSSKDLNGVSFEDITNLIGKE